MIRKFRENFGEYGVIGKIANHDWEISGKMGKIANHGQDFFLGKWGKLKTMTGKF